MRWVLFVLLAALLAAVLWTMLTIAKRKKWRQKRVRATQNQSVIMQQSMTVEVNGQANVRQQQQVDITNQRW